MNREYHKLVRDEIPRIIRESGREPITRVLTRAEALEELAKKLCEEAKEFRESREKEELADVLEVIRGIAAEQDISMDELEKIRARKAAQRGGFGGRIFLEEVHSKD